MKIQCDFCGIDLTIGQATFTPTDKGYIISCPQHTALFKTCGLCIYSQKCDFETNPSQTPKLIQKRIQQGLMTQVIQIKNPERIKETCARNCPCYDPEYQCGKGFGTCRNYNEVKVN